MNKVKVILGICILCFLGMMLYFYTQEPHKLHNWLTSISFRIYDNNKSSWKGQEMNRLSPELGPAFGFSGDEATSEKYIIYFCDGSFLCGGWADRFKGIVAAYLIANATRRKFRIHLTVPCDISTYLQPNQIDWRISISNFNNESSRFFMAISNNDFLQSSRYINFDDIFAQNITYFAFNLDIVPFLRENMLYHRSFIWMEGLENDQIYRIIYHHLFIFTPELDRKLHDFKRKIPHGYLLVCAQIRLGINPSNLNDTEVFGRYSDVPIVWDFFKGHSDLHFHRHGNRGDYDDPDKNEDRYKIFVTSDSEQVRSFAKSVFPAQIVDTSGDLVHIERSTKSKEEICLGLSKALLDQMILTLCDTLVISNSGYGETSAYLRGRDENLYCFRHSSLYKCSMSSFNYGIYNFCKYAAISVLTFICILLLLYVVFCKNSVDYENITYHVD